MPPMNMLSLSTKCKAAEIKIFKKNWCGERRYVMRPVRCILLTVVVLSVICACATTQPLAEGELRLLKMQVPENGNLRVNRDYRFIFNFESDGSAEITRAVCVYADTRARAYQPENVRYGSRRGSFSLWLSSSTLESQQLECYVDYVSGGKKRRSNSVYGLIYGMN